MARRQGRGRRRQVVRSEISRLSQQDVIDLFAQQQYLGSYQQVYTTGGRPTEKIPNSYAAFAETAYCSSSVVGAVMRVRRDIFRQARFTWREITEDGTGTLMHDDALAVLERPWPNGTTGELLTKMITDVDLCGNSFIANEDDRLRWRRPDWMYVVLSGDPNVDVDVDVIGYVYTPGGCDIRDGKPYLPEDICHWSPIPSWGAQYVGQSWMVSALKDIQADKAATDHKLSFFRNGATLGPIFVMPPSMTPEQFKKFRQANDEAHVGPENAYKPLYIGGGANVTMSSSTFQQLELKATQGAGESRIASLAGIHPAIAGLSEGLQGSSLNAGNFTAARRITSDITLMPLWQDACAALSTFVDVPDGYELWIRESAIPFLRDDRKDEADIFDIQMRSLNNAVREGWDPETAKQATVQRNVLVLKHSGLMSVQLQPPGSDQPDPESDGIAAGIDQFLGEATRARFNPADHPRNPKGSAGGGRFRSVAQRVVDALQEWVRSDREGDPFEGFVDREPLRKVAVARGIKLRRAASRDEIAQALKADLLEHLDDVPEDKPEPKKTAPKKALPSTPKLSDDPDVRAVQVENRIREAYAAKKGDGDWVALADIREEIGEDLNRHEVDEALKRLERQDGVNIVPQSNQKALTQADRDSAVKIGGQDKHFITIDDPSPRPEPKRAAKKAAPKAPDKPDLDLRELDDPEALRDALDERKVPELKDMLREQKLPLSGRKRDLVDRLVEHIHGGKEKPAKGKGSVLTGRAALESVPAQVSVGSIGSRTRPEDVRGLDRLTDRQRAAVVEAVDSYRGLGHQGINQHLRTGSPVRGAKTAIAGIDRGMAESRLPNDIVTFRTVQTGDFAFGPQSDWPDDLTGREWTDLGYPSTTTERELLAKQDNATVAMRVKVPAGTPAMKLSDFEAEVLLDRGLTFRVVADYGPTEISDGFGRSHRFDRYLDVEIVSAGKPDKKDTRPFPSGGEPAPAEPGATPIPVRDLFKAETSDADIETALRDVFEGQFGPYTTKVQVHVTRAGTRVDKRGRTHAVEPRISVEGKIYDEQGGEIGNFSRSIAPVEMHYADGTVRREVWAQHEVVQLGGGDYDENPTKYHGKGFGGEFNRRAIEWYRASGVHGIGQKDHNGYVWASQGFNFGQGGRVPDYLAENMRTLIADLRAGKATSEATKDEYRTIPKRFREQPDLDAQISAAEALLARVESGNPGDADYPTAYEISQLGRREGQRGKTALWLGKLLFVSASEMVLNPDEGEVVSQ